MKRKSFQFGVRSLLVLTLVVAATAPWWLGGYEEFATRQMFVPVNVGKWKKISPFTAVDFLGKQIDVEYDGTKYELVSINGVSTPRLLRIAAMQFGEDEVERRFVEDLPEVLMATGMKPNDTEVALTLRDKSSGKFIEVPDAEMTEENRRAAKRHRDRRNGGANLEALIAAKLESRDDSITLQEFKQALEQRWSYMPMYQGDLDAEMELLQARIRESAPKARRDENGQLVAAPVSSFSRTDFLLELRRILAMGIDGHASIRDSDLVSERGYLPFLIERIPDPTLGTQFVALLSDRSAFVSDEYPFLTHIDEVPIQEWIDVARIWNAAGSPQYVERHALRELRSYPLFRAALDIAQTSDVALTLRNQDGQNTQVSSALSSERPTYGRWPRRETTLKTQTDLAERDIGYIRLLKMDHVGTAAIHDGFDTAFENDYRAIIIDVRDNGGGSREALRTTFSYLVDGEMTRVVNAAAYRRFPEFGEHHLEARYMYRADDNFWTLAEREAIQSFRDTFEPEWQPPKDDYSDWHYMVLSKLPDRAYPKFDGKVVVLMNAKCFSATDIFLAGLKGMPNVTLVGEASGGGSARSVTARLAGGIEVRLGSMVSFQTNGKLFDGYGVEPDLFVAPTAESFLENGDDNVLAAALELIEGE